jgi:hypothetical protein
MSDPWTLISRFAARQAGHATADRLRHHRELADLAELEAVAGETMAGANYRLAYAVADLTRECWRRVARNPATALLPPVAVAVILAAYREMIGT